MRDGTAPEEILLVCPNLERLRAPLETALGSLGVPYAIEGRLRIGKTAFGQALLSLLRFEWLEGGRHDLYGFLRSPFSGLARAHVDYLEGRLRGRGVSEPTRVVEETLKLRGQPLRALDAFRAAAEPLEAVRGLVRSMLRGGYGLESPPVGEDASLDLRAHEAVVELLDELQSWLDLGGALTREELVAALERATLRLARGDEPGRVAVTDLLRARTRRTEVVFVLGLEEGSLPRRPPGSPFLAAHEAGLRLARALLLLHRLYAALEAAVPRPRGRERRGRHSRAEPLLGGGASALRPGRRGTVDAAAAAGGAHLAARSGSD